MPRRLLGRGGISVCATDHRSLNIPTVSEGRLRNFVSSVPRVPVTIHSGLGRSTQVEGFSLGEHVVCSVRRFDRRSDR